jgi:hypothetical protein
MKERFIKRKEANELYKNGWGIIDTSGRTRQEGEKSTIALSSNTIAIFVRFKSKLKKTILLKHSHLPYENLIL